MKIKGVKTAVGDYRRANGNPYGPRYGLLMMDCATGEVWVDEFYDLGHSWYTKYRDISVVNLLRFAENNYRIDRDYTVNMKNVTAWAKQAMTLWDIACERKEYELFL